MKRSAVLALICCLIWGLTCFVAVPRLDAHAVPLVIKARNMELKVTFGGGVSAPNAEVKVYRADGTLCQEGKTDENGVFLFQPQEQGVEWTIKTEHSGHIGESVYFNGDLKSAGEIPLYYKVVSGIGYLLGFAGITMGYLGLKAKSAEKKE